MQPDNSTNMTTTRHKAYIAYCTCNTNATPIENHYLRRAAFPIARQLKYYPNTEDTKIARTRHHICNAYASQKPTKLHTSRKKFAHNAPSLQFQHSRNICAVPLQQHQRRTTIKPRHHQYWKHTSELCRLSHWLSLTLSPPVRHTKPRASRPLCKQQCLKATSQEWCSVSKLVDYTTKMLTMRVSAKNCFPLKFKPLYFPRGDPSCC